MPLSWTGLGAEQGSYLDRLLGTKKPTQATPKAPANYFTPEGKTISGSQTGTRAPSYGFIDDIRENVEEERENIETGGVGPAPEPPPGITPQILYVSNDETSPYYYGTLGLTESYVGLPYQMGYWTGEEQPVPEGMSPELWAAIGAGRQWVTTRDLLPIAEQLQELQNIPIPQSPELTDITQTGAMADIQGLADLLANPNTTAQDFQAGLAQFEQMMGMAPGEYSGMMNQMTGQLGEGIMGQQGLGQQYMDQYDRQTQLELQQLRNDYTLLLEALGSQGRSVAGFQKMDQIALSLSSVQMQRDMELMNKDLAMKQAEYDALQSRWESLYNMGQMTAAQYMDNLRQNRVSALTAYAQELTAFVAQNQLVLQHYSADLQAAQLHAEITYQGIMADLGISESLMNQMNEQYEMYMAPYYAELEQYALEAQIALSQQGIQAQQAGNIITAAGGGAAIGFMAGGPVGAIVGGFLGFLGGMISSGTVICTELKRQGLLNKKTYEADKEFGRMIQEIRPDIYKGYLRFANPIVKLMKKSKLFTWIVNIFAQPWAKEMAYVMGAREKGSFLGRFIMNTGLTLCEFLGRNK